MTTRSISLSKRQGIVVEALVASGRYRDVNEVVGEALALVEQRHIDEAAQLNVLRAEIAVGVASFERGEFTQAVDLSVHLDALSDRALGRPEDA